MKRSRIFIAVLLLSLFLANAVSGADSVSEQPAPADSSVTEQTPKHDPGDLARKSQNPVSNMAVLPFQWNSYFQTGPKGKTQNVLLIEPAVPFKLNEDWNFIARPIIPLINQPPFTDSQDREYGLGNIQFEGFFAPNDKLGDWIVAFGPILEFPTNTDDQLGSDNWSAGPAFVALKMEGPWVYGSLITHLWSYAGSDPEVNLTSLNPFVNYNLKDGWYVVSSPVMTANWSADSSNTWTVPVGGGIGRVFHIGKQAVNARVSAYYNVETPDTGSDWQLQFQLSFLFPE
jgi:hypothetical protein